MFILRLTSDPSLHGLATDDGFKIGIISGSTMFLVAICTAFGLVGGVLYLVVRGWLPAERRALLCAGLAGVVGSSLVIKPDGIDITRVEPLALSIPMFILLPTLYGWAVSVSTERLLARKEATGHLSKLAFLPLLALALIGPFGIIVLAVGFLAWILVRRLPRISDVWHSPAVAWIGRLSLTTIAALSSVALAKDLLELL